MNRPLPHQLIQVLPVQACPPPLMPVVRLAEPPPAAPTPTPQAPRRRRRFRTPRALRDDAFWTGALTALCIGGLLMAIIATT
ncbi:hypothetical protein SAMN05216489_05578 [Streptomyces sp. 3213]|uniref:hypothetical protein n=1 Tax=Streptomyces sp. 3213.3 TaxID=1855348 RepID=UPI00089C84A3|nr:hypothetical protein [Streptomyces sp. 3213.3]SEE12352.1 hypothetical protein SAMN05216489_05578 [Streptomyces sp. 3213] [Streptomyces sp. 3213.3]